MVSLITNLIGYLAATVGVCIMLPQLIKSLKTKSVKDVSLLMLIFFILNDVLWLTYGILIKSYPVIVANNIGLMIVFAEFILKLKYHQN